jgi:uncharacterized membrane protein YhhN
MHDPAPVIVVGVIAALAAVANWWSRWREHRGVELVSKPLATVAIAGLAVTGALSRHPHPPTGAVIAGVIGFVLCLGGDVALLPAIDRFVVGLASFLAGHLAFVVMFALLGFDRTWLGLVALAAVAVVVATVGRRIVRGAVATDPALGIPVRAYLAVISTMLVAGWATGRPAAIVGAAAFVVSDAVLGWEQFVVGTPEDGSSVPRWMPVTIMVTYHAALAGIAISSWT